MRDIRQDLRERIAAEHARREPHQAAIKEIDVNVASLERLLALEEGRSSTNGALTYLSRNDNRVGGRLDEDAPRKGCNPWRCCVKPLQPPATSREHRKALDALSTANF